MTERRVRLFAEHVGELIFDGVHAVAAALNVGYPEIKRISSDSAAMYTEHTHAVHVGGSELVFEGYLLGECLTPGQSASGAWGADISRSCGESGSRGALSRLDESKAVLTSLCAPGQEFFLEVGGRRRALYASELSFSGESPFGTPAAEKFRLKAFSDKPFFHGEQLCFGGVARTQSALSFPASGEFSTAAQDDTCDVFIKNDGDEFCGFVLEAQFPDDTVHFRLSSDRETKNLHVAASIGAGERVLISTVTGDQYIKTASGTNLISAANSGGVFYQLPPGDTCLTLKGFTQRPPVVEVRFTPGYLIP